MRINRKHLSLTLLAVVIGVCQLPLSAVAQGAPSSALANPPNDINSLPASRDPQLSPVPGHANAQGWLSPDFRSRRATLHTLYVESIAVRSAPDSPYRDLSPNELATLNRDFGTELATHLPPDLKLVSAPQPDSMLVNVTLDQSEMKKDGFHLRNLTPFGFLISHAKTAAGVSKIMFERMVVDVRASDANGALLFVLDMKPQGIPADPASALTPAEADPNQVPMSPVRLDQMPAYLAAKTPKLQSALQALAS